MRHDFAGNIRELENIIEYGFVICHGSVIQTDHLPAELLGGGEPSDGFQMSAANPIAESVDERGRIIAALKQHRGNMTRAAGELGIHRTTLWRKLTRYQIDSDTLE